ncbi:MAG TPA: CHAT domain-containing protein [Acidobacteriota bacterium]|jgi:CHAT domain-containing protein/tetratricopeptide (TPR) repeat protein
MERARQRFLVSFSVSVAFLATFASPAQLSGEPPCLIVEEAVDLPASKAVLKPGDCLLAYNGKPLPSPAALQAAMENTLGLKEVALRLQRGEETLTLTVAAGALQIQARPQLPPSVLTLYNDGKAAGKAQKPDENIAKWTAAAQAAQESAEKQIAAWLYERAGKIHERQRQWKEAGAMHLAAWELSKESGDTAAQSRVLYALGRCRQNLNDFAEAQRWFEQGLQVDTAAGNEIWAAGDLDSLGIIARGRRDLNAAQDYHTRALAIRERRTPSSLDVAATLTNLAMVAWSQGEHKAAQDYHARAMAVLERLAPESVDIAAGLGNLGLAALSRRDLEAAQNLLSRSGAIYDRLAPNSPAVATSLGNRGVIAWLRGDLEGAQDYYTRALAIHERLNPNSMEVAAGFNNLGLVAWSRGNLEAAQDHHTRALAIKERLAPNSLDLANSLNNLGNVAYDRSDLQAAQSYHSRALAIREQLRPDSLDVAMTFNNLGNIAYARGDLAGAEDYHRRALTIRGRLAPNSLDVAFSLSTLGNIARDRTDRQAAQNYYSQALAIRERLAPNSLDVAKSLADVGHVALKERRFSDARALFTRAVDIVERHRRQIPFTESRALLLAKYPEPYTGLLRASVGLNNLPAAFNTVERARARSLLDLLAEANIDVQQGIHPELKQREQAAHSRIARVQRELIATQSQASLDKNRLLQLEEELKQVDHEREQLEVEIQQKHPRYAELQYPTPISLKGIQDLLDPQTALLEYALGEDRSFLFVVTRTESHVSELPAAASLSDRVKRLRETLIRQPQRTTFPSYIDQARALYQLLIEPAGRSLAGKKQLIIVPDGILHYLPFEVLLSSGDLRSLTAVAPRRWPYLIRDYAVSYVPSATVLSSLHQSHQTRPGQQKMLLAYADPAYGAGEPAAKSLLGSAMRSAFGEAKPWSLERLPESREEANRIASLYPQEKVRLFLQQDAREENVKGEPLLNQYRFIHFAVHGLLNETRPQFSGLVLSLPGAEYPKPKTRDLKPETPEPGKQTSADNNLKSAIQDPQSEDGLLQVYEIFDLRLNADLVVLSACETGLGKEVKGEGLVGLTRAFLYAGTPSVVVSLWKVSDRSTAELMVSFYQHLKDGTMNKAEALRQAQLKLIRSGRYAEPYYWAPFVLIGEAK